MPELPEVETVVRSLKPFVQGKQIQSLWQSPFSLRQISPPEEMKKLIGKTIETLERVGKYLLFSLQDQSTLMSHLGMSGRFLYFPHQTTPQKHTHVLLQFTDQSELHYVDPRRFGMVKNYEQGETIEELNRLGPDPFSSKFTLAFLTQKLRFSNREIKTWLLDQTNLAGLGNIYVAEVLFSARIHPNRFTLDLSKTEIKSLYASIRTVLQKGIENRGTTLSDGGYVDALGQGGKNQNQVFVYARKDQPCLVCHSLIAQQKQAQRSTYFCPTCQK